MKFIGIVGTNAKASTNRKLLFFMKKHFAEQAEIEIAEIADFPAFNEPTDHKAPTGIQELSDKIEAADGVIIATPEYDHSIPAVLKSLIEWLSYTTRPLINKPVFIVGASHGSLGTSRAQTHLRQILNAPELKALMMPGVEFLLGQSLQAFDENNNLIYSDKVSELEGLFAQFKHFVTINQKLVEEGHYNTEEQKKFSWEQAEGGTLS